MSPHRKPIEPPPDVARSFVEDMRAFLMERDAIKRDEIAARQLHALNEYCEPGQPKLRLSDVKKMFERMRDYLGDGD
jgi:hypothetical protein